MSVTGQINGNIPEYRFYITLTSITYEVFPLNFLNTTLIDEQEGNHAFYRRAFNGDLTFGSNSQVLDVDGLARNRKEDFLLLWDIEQGDPCGKIYFLIIKTVAGVSETYWEGHFSTTDGEFDLDKCTFTVSPHIDDIYADFIEHGDEEYNMVTMPTTATPDGAGALLTTTDTTHNYTRNRLFLDVIKYVVNQIVPGVGVVSTFFTAATNPVTLAANTLLYTFIATKSDIKNPLGAAATKGMLSFDDLMDICKIWNLRWDYDGTNITIEHESYWAADPGGIDTRTYLSAVATNKYKYTKETMPKFERFEWQESDLEFAGWPIWYDSPCVNQNSENNTLTRSFEVSTDIEYIDDFEVDYDGFVITTNSFAGTYAIHQGVVTNTGVTKYNAYMSWPNLHDAYWRHARVLINGYLNDEYNQFYSAKKTKLQEVQVQLCEVFDPMKEITTELGETYLDGVKATVKTAEIDPVGVVKLNLLYGPPDNENSGTDVFPKIIQIQEYVNSHHAPLESRFTLSLSELSAVDLTVKITLKIGYWDTPGHNVYTECYTSEETSVIPAGTASDTIYVEWCSPPVYDCHVVEYIIDVTGAPGWSYYLIEYPYTS